MMRFDRFAANAQDAAARAYELMRDYGDALVDTEHLLLALVEQPKGLVREILDSLGVDSEAISGALDKQLKRQPRTKVYGAGALPERVNISARLKSVIDQSNEEASNLKDDSIASEHLFLAITRERNTPSARILAEQGVTHGRAFRALVQLHDNETIRGTKAWRAKRRRAVLKTLPLKDVVIEANIGDDPALVLVQGEAEITVELAQVLALIGAISNAVANLAEGIVQEEA